jgi:hypothetical protein
MTKATLADKRVQQLVDELCNLVRRQFLEAEFEVYEGDDPRGVYILAYAAIDDTVDMLHLVSERLAEIIEEEGVIVGVIPLPKAEPQAV